MINWKVPRTKNKWFLQYYHIYYRIRKEKSMLVYNMKITICYHLLNRCTIHQYFISSPQKFCKAEDIIPILQMITLKQKQAWQSHNRTIPGRTKTQTHITTLEVMLSNCFTMCGWVSMSGCVYAIQSINLTLNLEPENMGVNKLYHVLAIPL